MHKTIGNLFVFYAEQAGHCPPTPLWGYSEHAVRSIVSAAVFIVAGGMYGSVILVTHHFFSSSELGQYFPIAGEAEQKSSQTDSYAIQFPRGGFFNLLSKRNGDIE